MNARPEPEPPDSLPPDLSSTPPADANADPLTGEPGAHPVGVGLGAAGTALVGAAIGALAGPLGVIAGTTLGAVAGGLLGKEAAESANPTAEAAADPALEPPPLPESSENLAPDRNLAAPATESLSEGFSPESGTVIARDSYPEADVRADAYQRYLHRREHGLPGDELSDWLAAEKQVL